SLLLEFAGNTPGSETAHSLQTLDVTRNRKYPLIAVVCESSEREHNRPQKTPQSAAGSGLRYEMSMCLLEARAEMNFDGARPLDRLAATLLVRDQQSPIKGTKVEVQWDEYKRDEDSNDYPDISDAGTFDARVLDPAAYNTSTCYLYLYLLHTR